jgi:hypothetical protein
MAGEIGATAKLAESSITVSEIAGIGGRPTPAVPGYEQMSRVECIRPIQRFLYSRHRALGAVVGVAGQNGRAAVNLFKKHDADHLMRPGRRAERNA